jgi:CO/xanthine dehydrogenase Mo-binding subunit
MEPESALAYPPDKEGVVLVLTGEQKVYDGRRYVADTLGLSPDKVRVVSAYVGGGFGGKEDQTGAACIGQGLATVLTQIACDVLSLDPAQVRVSLPDTSITPDSGTTTASRQTPVTGEACRRACTAAREALRETRAGTPEDGAAFTLAALAGKEFRGEYEALTDPFESEKPNPIRHVAYSYACQLAVLGEDGRLDRVVAAHDSGVVVNPLAFEGQVEGGVVMGLGFALTESFPLVDCVPTTKFEQLGLLRATDVLRVQTIIVKKAGAGGAVGHGGAASVGARTTATTGGAYGAKGIGEISSIPTAAAVAGAYFARDGKPYSR